MGLLRGLSPSTRHARSWALALFLVLGGASTASAQNPVFHPLLDRGDCHSCHDAGPAPSMPTDHRRHTNASCTICHAKAGGTAGLLYGSFIPVGLVFLVGLAMALRCVGPWRGKRSAGVPPRPRTRRAPALRRFLAYGLLQRKVVARSGAGWISALIFWSFALLLLGSVCAQVESYFPGPRGAGLRPETVERVFQTSLDIVGLVFVVAVLLAFLRRVAFRPRSLPRSTQAVVVLLALLFLGVSGFLLEGIRLSLASPGLTPRPIVGHLLSLWIGGSIESQGSLLLYQVLWWSHAVVSFALIVAIPCTRLVHMFGAAANVAIPPTVPKGALETPFDLAHVLETGEFDVQSGSGTVAELTWKQRLGLAACTNCGRCQAVCPSHTVGGDLSPTSLVHKLREQMALPGSGGTQDRDLLAGVVAAGELWACTMCGACAESCPVLIDPTAFVVELRRELVTRNVIGREASDVLSNLSVAANPYGSPQSERQTLAADLGAPTVRDNPSFELLYWVGCAATYDPAVRDTAKAMVKILETAGVNFAILGEEEGCSGDVARRIGEEGRFQELVHGNLETFGRHGVKRVVTHCAHCFNSFKNEYPRFGSELEVHHHAAYIEGLASRGRLPFAKAAERSVTLHDSCYVGRFNGEAEPARQTLRRVPGVRLTEMERNRERGFCCGSGGANYWFAGPQRGKIGTDRVREATATGADVLAVECPFCLRTLGDSASSASGGMQVQDIAVIVASALE